MDNRLEEQFEDEDVEVDDYNDEEYEEELIPEDMVVDVEEEDDEEEEDEELIPLERMLPEGSNEYEDYEDEELEEIMFPRVSSSFSEGRDLVEDDSKACEGKPELNRSEIDGLFCPICFEAWTSGGDHQICCLPCGHIYGSSCIKKWLQQRSSSGKCPQCNKVCTLKDVRVLYASRLCVADEALHKRVRSLEAECSYLKKKDKYKGDDSWREEYEAYLEEFKAHRLEFKAHREEFEALREEVVAFKQQVETQHQALQQQFEALRHEVETRRHDFDQS